MRRLFVREIGELATSFQFPKAAAEGIFMSNLARNLVALASLIAGSLPGLTACRSSSADHSVVRSGPQGTSTATAQSRGSSGDNPPADAEGSSDEPVWINGAYLTCDYDAVVGDDGSIVRLACSINDANPEQPITEWAWKVIGPEGVEQTDAVVTITGSTAIIEIPAKLLSSVSLAVRPTANSEAQVGVVSSVKDAVQVGLSQATSAAVAEAKTKQLLGCFDEQTKAPTQCFADAGFTAEALVSPPAGDAVAKVADTPCTPSEILYVQGTIKVVVPPGCILTVSLWGGGGSGGGVVDGLPGGDSRFFDLLATGGRGGEACAVGGAGGDGGEISSENSNFDGLDGDFGEDAVDPAAGVGGAGGNAGSDADFFAGEEQADGEPANPKSVSGTGGEAGKSGTVLGGGGGGATGTTDCGGGGGGGGFLTARYTLQDLIDAGAVPSEAGSVELQGEVGGGGPLPIINGNAGMGANGGILVVLTPETPEDAP
jgi:hypothetical protein